MAIKKLGNKKYKIRVTKYINKKKRERKFTGKFETMGQVKAKERELDEILEKLKYKEENLDNLYTWRKAVDDYLDHSQLNHKLSTFYNREKVLSAHTSNWSDVELHEITNTEVKELIDSRDCSISHKKEILKYIRQVFETAIDNRKIDHNPAKRISVQGDELEKDKAKKLEAMTKTEVSELLTYMKEINHEWYSIFYVTYQLGLRCAEAIALEFQDIDWQREHVVISKSWCKHKLRKNPESRGMKPPKNGTSRIVPMNKQIKFYLKELSLKSGNKGFVLPRIKSWMNGGASKVLRGIQKQLGIKQTNYHSLRSSFITHLLRSGMDVVRVQAMVGHKELATTQRYIRLDATDLQGATKAIELDFEPKGRVLSFEKDKS